MIFAYPKPRTQRRHAPRGYASPRSYRPWLRDEFTFRCAYCLKREQWGQATGEFDLDHFQPQSLFPQLAAEYTNMVYACRRCNGVKQDQEVDDPFATMTEARVRTMPDGTVKGADDVATRLILTLDLNSPRLIEWRIIWMRIIELAKERDRTLWEQLVGFPTVLPDLSRLRPPAGNERPEGVAESWAALARQDRLPGHY